MTDNKNLKSVQGRQPTPAAPRKHPAGGGIDLTKLQVGHAPTWGDSLR